MKYFVIICRVLLGLAFCVFGANILHPFLPMPPMQPDSLPAKFMVVMGPTHYMAMIGAFQLLGGLCVLIGGLAPIGLVLLGPVLVNILAFHVFIEGGTGVGMGLFFSALEIFLIYSYRSHFAPLFTVHARTGN
jgi:putative oxidoreductase